MLKKFRVIVQNRNQRIRGMKRGETFEAEWPDPWLERRIATHHIEMVEEPKPVRPKPKKQKAVEEESESPVTESPKDTKKEEA